MVKKNLKIGITTEADKAIERMHNAVNEGFLGGKVNKPDLVSWIVLEFEKNSFAGAIEDIRKQNFDQLRYLESVLRLMKKSRRDGEPAPALNLPLDFDSVVR